MTGILYRDNLILRRLKEIICAAAEYVSQALGDSKPLADEDARRREQRAGELLDLYGNCVLRYAYSYLHNMADAEDILQETLIRYLKSAPTFESSSHEKAWLLRVAANLSKNRIDYNKVRLSEELNEEIAADEKEDLSFVWEAVKQLPQTQREAVHLFYQEGYSTAEIAKILSRRESTVRSDLKRGREKLKVILREAYDFE